MNTSPSRSVGVVSVVGFVIAIVGLVMAAVSTNLALIALILGVIGLVVAGVGRQRGEGGLFPIGGIAIGVAAVVVALIRILAA